MSVNRKEIEQLLKNIDFRTSSNPMGLLSMAIGASESGISGASRMSKKNLFKIIRGEKKSQYISATDAFQELNRRYKSDSGYLTNSELQNMVKVGALSGIPFYPKFSGKRAAKRAMLNLLDMAALGFVSNDYIDRVAPAITSGEKLAGQAGSLLGFAMPFGLAGKAAGSAMKGLGTIGAGKTVGLGKGVAKRLKDAGYTDKAKTATKVGGNVEESLRGLASWATANQARQDAVQRAIQLGLASGGVNLYDQGLGGALASGVGGMALGGGAKALGGLMSGGQKAGGLMALLALSRDPELVGRAMMAGR